MVKKTLTLSAKPAAEPTAPPADSTPPADDAADTGSDDAADDKGDEPNDDAANAAAPQAPVPPPAWAIGDHVHLVPTHGPLHHLHIDIVFGAEPTLAEIDAFIALQLEAGKLAIHSDET